MSNNSFSPGIWWWLFLALFSPLVAVGLVHAVIAAVGFPISYLWLAVGVVAFLLFNRLLIKGKDDFIRTFSHETNHAVASLLMFKKVHSFHAGTDSGVVYHTAGGRLSTVVIALAPYCLPLFSYALLLVRAVMLPQYFWIADILIGVTIGFYISVFRQQTGSHQVDIQQFNMRLFPYWYIVTFLAFNATIIVVSLMPDKNVVLAFADTFVDYWRTVVGLFNTLLVK